MKRFQQKLDFPNVIGAVDCTHIGIVAPKQNENGVAYLNRKGYYSLNVQMVDFYFSYLLR